MQRTSEMSSEMLWTLSLATEDIFQVHSQKQPVANIPVVDFRSQLNTEFVTFIFSLGILVVFLL